MAVQDFFHPQYVTILKWCIQYTVQRVWYCKIRVKMYQDMCLRMIHDMICVYTCMMIFSNIVITYLSSCYIATYYLFCDVLSNDLIVYLLFRWWNPMKHPTKSPWNHHETTMKGHTPTTNYKSPQTYLWDHYKTPIISP